MQSPRAELAFWTRVTLRRMRTIASGEDPMVRTVEQLTESMHVHFRRPSESLVAEAEATRGAQTAYVQDFISKFGPPPTPEFFDLIRTMDKLKIRRKKPAAGEAHGVLAKPGGRTSHAVARQQRS